MPRILYVADGRSPTALNWIRYFVERGYEVHLASTFDCAPAIQFTSLSMIRVAFSGLKKQKVAGVEGRSSEKGAINRMGVGLRTTLRQWFGPLTLPYAARRLSRLAARLQPDLIHAMRIPYEGMLAGLAQKSYRQAPLLVSVHGSTMVEGVTAPTVRFVTDA